MNIYAALNGGILHLQSTMHYGVAGMFSLCSPHRMRTLLQPGRLVRMGELKYMKWWTWSTVSPQSLSVFSFVKSQKTSLVKYLSPNRLPWIHVQYSRESAPTSREHHLEQTFRRCIRLQWYKNLVAIVESQ